MSEISGVVFEKDINTRTRYVRHDRNDDFWKDYATAITGDELRRRMYKRIDEWKWSGK